MAVTAFSLCCGGLWLVLRLFEGISRARFSPWADVPLFTQVIMRDSWLLFLIPVPVLIFGLLSCCRKEQRMEATILLLTVLGAGFAVLFFSVAVAIVLPWLPHT